MREEPFKMVMVSVLVGVGIVPREFGNSTGVSTACTKTDLFALLGDCGGEVRIATVLVVEGDVRRSAYIDEHLDP